MPHIRPIETVESALRASDAGVRDADNADLHDVAVKTIRRWRRLYQRQGLPRGQSHTDVPCPRCDSAELGQEAYAELFGWYLGDGHITEGRRGVFALHIVNDQRYVDDNARLLRLMASVKPGGRPHTRMQPGCVITTVSWKHWPCLIPQHGPGRKHERPIVLEPWQRDLLMEHPGRLLRGLFHSDGCRAKNWTRRQIGGEWRRYDYPRWQFTNNSDDIRGLCCWALDLVDVAWRQSNWNTISVSRREAVARLDELIGLKS